MKIEKHLIYCLMMDRKSKVDAKLNVKEDGSKDGENEVMMMIIVMMIVTDDDEDAKGMSKGDRVEAKLKGWTKYYKGKITSVNRDGTYDILFDDGDRKSKVDAKLIDH